MFWLTLAGLLCLVHSCFAATLSGRLTYITGLQDSSFPNFTLIEVVDEEEIYYYDSKNMTLIRKYDWSKKVEDSNFYTLQETFISYLNQISFNILITSMNLLNQTHGVHTLQGIAGCDLNGSSFGIIGYDGEDLMSFNSSTLKCTAAKNPAIPLEQYCNFSKSSVDYFEVICDAWLNGFSMYGKATLNRKVQPKIFLTQRELQGSLDTEVTCLVTGFFPQDIAVTWVRDGGQLLEANNGDIVPNNDDTYQVRKSLTVSLPDKDQYTYSCQVEHVSFSEKQIVFWNYKGLESRSKAGIIVGVIIAVLVLIALVIAGLVIWKKSQGVEEDTVTYIRNLPCRLPNLFPSRSFQNQEGPGETSSNICVISTDSLK